jgi:hypothetical protein
MPPGMPQQGLGYWSMLTDPRTSAVGRAEAMAGLGGPGQMPQGPAAVPPAPPVDLPAAFADGIRAANSQPDAYARGGRVRGYARGGGVDDMGIDTGEDDDEMPQTAGLESVSPILLQLTKRMMPGMGGDDEPLSGNDKGLALARAGFAMAAGNSPNALQNFGAGASEGIDSLMKLRQQRALQRMKEAAMMGSMQQRQEELGLRRDIAIQTATDRADALAERKREADERAADRDLDRAAREAAHAESADIQRQLLELRKGTLGSTLPEGTGDNFLEQLPTADQAVIKKVAAGEVDPRSLTQRDGYRNRIIAATSQYDPAYDQANVGARFQLKKDFASGKSAQNITSANTLIGHLESLKQSADKLKNTNYPMYNTVANWAASNTGDPRVKDFNTKRQAVADELTRLFRGTGGTLTEIQEWQKNIDTAGSQAQLDTVISSALELMRSRVESLASQYNRGFGTQKTADDFLSPKSQKIISTLDKAVIPPEGAAPAAAPGIVAPAIAAPGAAAAPVIRKYNPKTGKLE